MQNGRRRVPAAPCRALLAPAPAQGGAAGWLCQAWGGSDRGPAWRIVEETILHQRSPENEQEEARAQGRLCQKGTRVHCSFMTDPPCLLEGKTSSSLVIKLIKVSVPSLH